MGRIILFSCICVSVSCGQNDCNKFQGKRSQEIGSMLSDMPVGPLSHELFILGDCKIKAAIPILEQYLDDPRVSHHALHKGMSLSQIAEGSIRKISKADQ